MKRNIITTIEFSNGHLSFNTLEELSNNSVEIYSAKSKISRAHSFLNECIKITENKIGGKISEVVVVIEESKKVQDSIELVQTSIKIAGDVVSKKDIDNLIELTKRNNQKENKKVILIQPLQFEVEDVIKKAYSKAPIHKKGNVLSATFAITSVNSSIIDFVEKVIKSQKLSISQTLLKSQTISQNNLSENALASGASLVHIGENQSFVSINKNFGTVATMSFYDVGYKKLISGISKVFKCSLKEARELVTVYGSLNMKENRVIYILQEGIKETKFTMKDLTEIINAFTRRLLVLSNKFIQQKGVQNLPVVFSGKLASVEGFNELTNTLFTSNTTNYKPMTYVEMNSLNRNSLGFAV